MLCKCYVNTRLYSCLTISQTIFISKIPYLSLVFFVTFSHNQKFRIFKRQIRTCVERGWGGLTSGGQVAKACKSFHRKFLIQFLRSTKKLLFCHHAGHSEQLCHTSDSSAKPHVLLRITAFRSLNSLPRIAVPSFVYSCYSKQGISNRTYCYTEQGIRSKARITAFVLNSLPLISVSSFLQYRYYSKQSISRRTHCYTVYGIRSKARIYGLSN